MIFKKKEYHKYANLIRLVDQIVGSDIAAKYGFDLFMGLHEKNIEKRYIAWNRYLYEVQRNDAHTDEMRNGIWVPAIEETL